MAAFTDVVPTPIAQLSPELPAVPSAVRGIVTIIWPYSSSRDLFAFILAEPDLRLRRPKGQVRVNLYGLSAKAVVASGLSSGDRLLISLEGAEWEPAEANRGAGLEWQLKFTNKAQLQVTDGETSEAKTVQVDPSLSTETEPVEDAQPEDPTLPDADTKEFTPPPPAASYFTPAKPGHLRSLVDGEFESPAFVKRARVSYGSLFEDGFDIFDEDGGARGRGRKRARFGRPSGAWRYTSQSPSPEREPEPEVSASEQGDEEMAGPAEATVKPDNEANHPGPSMAESEGLRASPPARPQMTDEACQTVEMNLPTTLTPNAVNTADDKGSAHPPPPPDVPVAAHSHEGSLDPSQQPIDFGTWPDDATMAMTPFTDADKFAQGPLVVESLNPDLQLGVVEDHFHQPWMSHDNYLDNPHNYSEMTGEAAVLPSQPVFDSGFPSENSSNLGAVRFGFGGSDVRDAPLSPRPGNDMIAHGLPLETYPHIGGEHQQSPFVQATTDYPPLDAAGKVVSVDTAPQPNANPFAAPSLTETALLSRENTSIPDQSHLDTQAALHRADASVPAWPVAESDARSVPRFSKENSASADGHTSESALVVDHGDSDGEIDNGMPDAGVVASLADRGYDPGAVDPQGDLGEAPLEVDVEVEYPGDEEPEYDEDDIGDYDTRQYIGPDDDEDDSHDEDLRPHSLEEPFDDGEEEEEEDDVDEDESEDDGEYEYESDEEMGNGSPNPQRPPPTASSAPVVIDLLSSDEEEEGEEEEEKPQPPLSSRPVSNVQTVPTRPAPVRTSPEYGPESEEGEEIKDEDEDEDEDDDDDDQASSDGDNSQVAEYMSESYHDSSGPEDSADDSDGAENGREEAPTAVRETMPVTPAKQALEPDEKTMVEQEPPQQATSPEIPADTDAPASDAVDEEMKDVQTETEDNVVRSLADQNTELLDSDPTDAVGILGDSTAEFERANAPSSKEAETTEPAQEETHIQVDEIQVQADSPAPVHTERVEEDDDMADAPAAPSSPDFAQSYTSHVMDEKHDIVVQDAPMTGDAEETEAQLDTPMDTQLEMSVSHDSIARTAISTGENGTFSDAPAEAGSDAIEVHLKESVVHEEAQVLGTEGSSSQRAPSMGEQMTGTALETSITVTAGPSLSARSEAEEVEVITVQVASPSQARVGAEDEREVDDSDAASVISQSDHDDALQALLREEHSKIIEVDDEEPSLSRLEASTPSPDAEIVAASSPYGDDAQAQEFQSATSSVHENAAESLGHDTSTEQPEFSDAMEIQEHGEDATSDHGDQRGPPSVQTNEAFSDASTGYTSQPTTRLQASRQRASTREDTDDDQGDDPSIRLARAAIARGSTRADTDDDQGNDPSIRLAQAAIARGSTREDTDDDQGEDPSIRLARAAIARGSTREDTDDDQGDDPSIRLARASIASRRGTRRRGATPEPTHLSIKTRSSHKSSSPDFGDDSVQIARASLNTSSKLVAKARSVPRSTSPASSKMDEDTTSVKDAKMKLIRHIRDELPDFTKLGIIRQHVGQSIDVLAVALMAPPEPRRAKGGPREYLMSFTVTDYSIAPTGVAEVQLYRPHKDSLPKVKAGDIVLLRSFAVVSLKGKGYGLQTSEVSSWAVFDKEGEPPQIRGPPVEYGEAESTYASYLRDWFGLLDEKARERLFKANQKIVDAGKAK